MSQMRYLLSCAYLPSSAKRLSQIGKRELWLRAAACARHVRVPLLGSVKWECDEEDAELDTAAYIVVESA